MKFKKLLSLSMATIIILGYVPASVTTSVSDCIVLETSAASNSKLNAPGGIITTAASNSITLKWNKVSGADGYRIYMYNSAKKKYVKYKSVSGTKCTVSNLKIGTKYNFKITALVKKNGKYYAQKASNKISVSTKKLIAPPKITANAGFSSIALKWNKVKGADAYRIYKYNNAKKKYVAVKTTSKTNYTVTKLSSGTTYKFKIAALVKNGKSYSVQTLSPVILAKTSTKATLQTADFTVYDKNGNKVSLSDHVGKPIVVNIWATWCGPCRTELPHFNKLYDELGDDVVFMMVNCTGGRETESKVKQFIKESDYDFPVYFDKNYSANSAYNVSAIPTTLFINRDGKLVHTEIGSMDEDELRGFIKQIM